MTETPNRVEGGGLNPECLSFGRRGGTRFRV